MTLGEVEYLEIITVMMVDDGRGHCVLCQGLSCSPGGFAALREWSFSSENKQLLPAEGPCH